MTWAREASRVYFKALLAVVVWVGLVFLFVVSLPGCASTQSQLKESRAELKAVNPAALQTRPEYQKRLEITCDGHGGLGLVREVRYSCNDGAEGVLEVRE